MDSMDNIDCQNNTIVSFFSSGFLSGSTPRPYTILEQTRAPTQVRFQKCLVLIY